MNDAVGQDLMMFLVLHMWTVNTTRYLLMFHVYQHALSMGLAGLHGKKISLHRIGDVAEGSACDCM